MRRELDLNQILFEELVEFSRKGLGIPIRDFCAEAHVGTATYSKAKKKRSINPQSLSRLVQELCYEMDEPLFMMYGAAALKALYWAMRGMEYKNNG
ncbi:MAG: hypothetical protein PHC95_15850 [Parabacteroides sp.]|nr:hypothetical protein [Parabacteroides sp.]